MITPPHPRRAELAAAAGVSELTAQLLLNRGVNCASEARKFLAPELKSLGAPDDLPGAREAAERLEHAVRRGRRIVIYGDYDVDGVTATAILWHGLHLAGGDVSYYVPNRLDEGYGLNGAALEQLKAQGAELIISVDCGITAVEEARRARQLGLELIITDHHQPHAALPDALLVHPTALDRQGANPHLSGAGVALKIAWAFAQRWCAAERVDDAFREYLLDATAFAALGLVADVVPLTGENRVITAFGLRRLERCANVGLQALIEASGLSEKRRYDDYDVGFTLAPRLNAVGRMGDAALAVELFTTADASRAAEIARTLNAHNRERQKVERGIVRQAEALVIERGYNRDGCHAIVLAHEEWHAGVIGIVASRMVERFNRPTVLIALNGASGQGSGRSIRHFPLHEVLEACSSHLMGHGGHAMAAGVRIAPDKLEDFTRAFQAEAAQRLTPRDLTPTLRLDDETPLGEVNQNLINLLGRLAPHGQGNPRPRLATTPVEIVDEPRACGANGAHLRFVVRQNGVYRKAIAFDRGGDLDRMRDERSVRLAFEPIANEWNGRTSVELRVLDWKPA